MQVDLNIHILMTMAENLILSSLTFLAFALFHSVTAHEKFKAVITRFLSAFFVVHFWRLIYCVVSFWMLYYLFLPTLFQFNTTELLFEYPQWTWPIVAIVYLSGVAIAYMAFIQVGYFEFWGLKQAWQGIKMIAKKQKYEEPMKIAGVDRLEVHGIYKWIRHPMLTGGFLMALSQVPVSATVVYLVYYTVYMIIGGYYEEKRLIQNLGPQYLEYKKDVGAFFPKLKQYKNFFSKLDTQKREAI